MGSGWVLPRDFYGAPPASMVGGAFLPPDGAHRLRVDRLDLPREARSRLQQQRHREHEHAPTGTYASRKALAADPGLSIRDLSRKIAIATKHTVSQSKVQGLRAAILADLPAQLDNERAQAEREPAQLGPITHATAALAEAQPTNASHNHRRLQCT